MNRSVDVNLGQGHERSIYMVTTSHEWIISCLLPPQEFSVHVYFVSFGAGVGKCLMWRWLHSDSSLPIGYKLLGCVLYGIGFSR